MAPTEAGEQLLASLRPAFGDIRGALERIFGLRERPAGRVRLPVPRLAAMTVLSPKLGRFARDYPEAVLDISTHDSGVDLVAGGFEAGIHLGEFIERDMIAVRVSRDHRPRNRGVTGTGGIYRWEFDKDDQSLAVAVNGPLIVDDVDSRRHQPAALSALIETLRL